MKEVNGSMGVIFDLDGVLVGIDFLRDVNLGN